MAQAAKDASPAVAAGVQDILNDTGADDPGVNAALSGNLNDTPRTREALKRCGVLMTELKIQSFSNFYRPTDTVEKQRLRYNHFETRRQAKLATVLQERAKVFVEVTKKQTANQTNAKSYQSMNMLEELLDQEATRLEAELKQQLRWALLPSCGTTWYLQLQNVERCRGWVCDDLKWNGV